MIAALAWYQRPEYLHALLNAFPTHGLLVGIVCLAVGLALRQRVVQVTGLAIVLAMCVTVWPVEAFGHRAYDRVYSMSNADGEAWLDAHADRAEDGEWVFVAAGVLAALAIAAPRRYPRTALPLTLLAIALALAAQGTAVWIAAAGGKVRHTEFRVGPPPPAPRGEHGD